MNVRVGKTQQKIITVLLAGVAFGLCQSARKQWRILTEELPQELEKINRQSLEYGLHRLVDNKYISLEKSGKGIYRAVLTAEGRKHAQIVSLSKLEVKVPKVWDKKWRLVFFDIPEKLRKVRDSLRENLKAIGFMEMQRSVLCFPYPCGNEVIKIVAHYHLADFVHYAVADEVSDSECYQSRFNLKK